MARGGLRDFREDRTRPTVPADLEEEDFRALSRDALRRRRLWLLGIVGNALVALVLVGGPYWRGRERAFEARRDFAALCACLWNAEIAPSPGLTLPPVDLPAYADAAADPEWPSRCVARAEALAPEAAFWLFPDTRAAEDDLRRAGAMVARELRDASSAVDPGASVPMRPRLAVLRLAAAIGVLAREADASLDLDAPAILLPEARTASPERVPLRAMSDALVEMRPWAEGVELLALDARGVSWTRVGGGQVDHRRLRRPALVSGVTRDAHARPWLIWSTPEARCAATGCARQALGVAPLDDATVVTPRPSWLAAHPWRGPRSVAIGDDAIWVLALTDDSGAELRRFSIPSANAEAASAEAASAEAPSADDTNAEAPRADGTNAEAPRADDTSAEAPSADDTNAEAASADAANADANAEDAPRRAALAVRLGVDGAAVVDAGRVTFPRAGELVEWHEGDERSFGGGAVERQGAIRVVRDGATRVLVHDDGRRARLDDTPDGALRAVADRLVIGAVVLDRERRVHAIRCAPACDGWREIGRGVRAFEAAALGGAILIATVQRARGAQVVRRLDDELGPPVRPGACFREGELVAEPTGMCGPPLMVAAEDRVIVGARDGEDVLVVESRDGRTFEPLRGLR
jgi:hypothetical protein